MVLDTARALAQERKQSEEYTLLAKLKEEIAQDTATKTLLDEYHKMQIKAQATIVSGRKDDELMAQLQKMGELLQMNTKASAYLIAEYRLNKMLSDVYRILGDAVGIDLTPLEG